MEALKSTFGRPDHRDDQSRDALLAAARSLFVKQGFHDTTTDQIVLAAAVSRKWLYIHFEDKKDLFRALLQNEQAGIDRRMQSWIDRTSREGFELLVEMAAAFIAAASVEGTREIVFIEGPEVLGQCEWKEIQLSTRERVATTLRAVKKAGGIKPLPVAPLADMLTGVLSEAAAVMDESADQHRAKHLLDVIEALLDGVRAPEPEDAEARLEAAEPAADAPGPDDVEVLEGGKDAEAEAETTDSDDDH